MHGTTHLQDHEEDIRACSDNLEQLSSKKVDVFIDDSKLYNLNLELAKFVTIKNTQFFKPQVNTDAMYKSTVSNINPYLLKTERKEHATSQIF